VDDAQRRALVGLEADAAALGGVAQGGVGGAMIAGAPTVQRPIEVRCCEIGDCRETMRRWIADGVRVQMCVTSPPYWGLRDYGVSGQLGLEPTPAEYVANMVEVFRLVRELLADDGVLWLNLGDSYATGAGRAFSPGGGAQGDRFRAMGAQVPDSRNPNSGVPVFGPNRMPQAGLKPKDLIGIPWRVAFALQADGWYLRSDIIWSKPNPMPESVTDRPTKAHEYLFLLAKRARYYYDAEAIAEPLSTEPHAPGNIVLAGGKNDSGHMEPRVWASNGTRNRRSVWTIPTQPYSGAHFATFPEALVEPCVLAGSRPGDVVLDPFFGSGTVGQVCERLGRRWLGCELSEEYGKLAEQRTAQQGLCL
jgi:site-specific DNA-methyltransferase (cytosine-N4-specific)